MPTHTGKHVKVNNIVHVIISDYAKIQAVDGIYCRTYCDALIAKGVGRIVDKPVTCVDCWERKGGENV